MSHSLSQRKYHATYHCLTVSLFLLLIGSTVYFIGCDDHLERQIQVERDLKQAQDNLKRQMDTPTYTTTERYAIFDNDLKKIETLRRQGKITEQQEIEAIQRALVEDKLRGEGR